MVDTPGIITTEEDIDSPKVTNRYVGTLESLDLEIAKTVQEFINGIHVFIYVLNIASPRFTPQDQVALKKVMVNTLVKNRIEKIKLATEILCLSKDNPRVRIRSSC